MPSSYINIYIYIYNYIHIDDADRTSANMNDGNIEMQKGKQSKKIRYHLAKVLLNKIDPKMDVLSVVNGCIMDIEQINKLIKM